MPRERPLLILLAGMPGSGKSLVASVARGLGIKVYTMGDVVREEARRRGVEPTPSNLNRLARLLREEQGEDVIARKILESITRDTPRIAVVDGVRSLQEVKTLQGYGRTIIVAVHASPATRYERLRSRGRPGDPESWEEFAQRDLTELAFGLGSVIALADYMLVNELDKKHLEREAKHLLSTIVESLARDDSVGRKN